MEDAVEQPNNVAANPAANPARHPVKLAEFWQEEPALWFTQAEAQFRRGNVLDATLRADYLIASLLPVTLKSVRDILTAAAPDDVTLYQRLKDRLVHRFAATKWSLAFQILAHPGLGDLRPSQLLDAMLALLPVGEQPGVIFQALFLQRLPTDMRDHLVAANLETPREMAVLADRMWDSRSDKSATVAAVRGASPARQGGQDRRTRSPRRRAATPGADGLCFYHSRFGANAHKCSPPCTWTGPAPSGNGTAAGGN